MDTYKLRSPHNLQEVPRPLELSHEFDEESATMNEYIFGPQRIGGSLLRASISIYTLHKANHRADKAIVGWRHRAIGHDGRVRAVGELCDRRTSSSSACGSSLGGIEVGLGMRKHW